MEQYDYANGLIDYLSKAPEPYSSIAFWKDRLLQAGAEELNERERWDLKPNSLYYFVKDGTQLAAFRTGTAPLAENGFRIAGAHHDAPGFHIKPAASAVENGFERLVIEPYGGLNLHSWFDRPLGVAGRLCLKTENGIEAKNILIRDPILIIPSPAVHIKRDIDEKKPSVASEVIPIFALNDGKATFLSDLAERTGYGEEDILSFELYPFEAAAPCFVGRKKEMISAGHLDDASMVYCSLTALLETKDSPYCCVAFAFDHEEIGSSSTRGAKSNSVLMTLERICEKFQLTTEEKYMAYGNSLLFSADMAHATHPAYLGSADSYHKIYLNKGPVLKEAYYQSYSTSSRGSAIFKALCRENNIPYQVFVNHGDSRGGGTIGPILASASGITSVDIGNPMLSMHSVRELGGSEDVGHMINLFSALFSADLTGMIVE